ncbi:hypothetical protein BUE80_DR013942 [Diplocarpon rosae]|nr:hypothetical protein BUE80_DR013942 [Diplocarpon rosae]
MQTLSFGSKKPASDSPLLTIFNIDIVKPLSIIGSKAIWVYAIKLIANAYNILINFINIINTQFSNTKLILANIKAFKLDNAREFKLEK